MKKIPKYIYEKCRKIDEYMQKANNIRIDVEKWAEENGIDIYSDEYRDEVCVEPICHYGIEPKYLEDFINKHD